MEALYQAVSVSCRCGEKMNLQGTYQQTQFTVETCHKCHQAYTGEKVKHSAGSIDKYAARFGSFGLDGE